MPVDSAVARACERRNAPLSVAVGGHGRTGKNTLAAAVRSRFRLSTSVIDEGSPPGEADLTIRVIGAEVRRCDLDAVASCRGPLIVVAGKADLRDDPAALAERAAARLGVPVHPVSGLLASATVGPSDVVALTRDPVDVDVLRRFGCAAAACARDLDEPTADDLAARLREISGIDALAPAIRAASTEVGLARDRRLRAELRLAAARGSDRDLAEAILRGAAS